MKPACSTSGRDDLAVLFSAGAIGTRPDAELLARFATGRGDPAAELAFAALVDRHGPMVLGVCRRATGDPHAADDAFQAVFLVLARKAGAVRLGPDDSLGGWLRGVSLRVARRARVAARKRALGASDLDGLDPVAPGPSLGPGESADLRAAIDAEIARLPGRYRAAVVLCHLEGLSQEQAARRLRCPVGTVQSRLHRARERLRSGLTRRGLAPAVGASIVAMDRESRGATVPPGLARKAVEAASRASAGGVVPAAVAGLAGIPCGSILMNHPRIIAGLVALGLATTGAAFGLATGAGDEPRPQPPAPAPAAAGRPEPTLAEQFAGIEAEYEAAWRAYHAFYQGSTIPEADLAKAARFEPDDAGMARRIFDLAASSPRDPAARDAMIWLIQQSQGGLAEADHAYGFARAANWLLRYHGDDPEAVRVGLDFDNWPTADRDKLLLGFLASANARESKGLARLALAQYLECKASFAQGAREVRERPIRTHDDLVRADGTLYSEQEAMPLQEYAYVFHLKQCDVAYLQAEAERLYEEVIADYADIPHITARQRSLEALLRQPEPRRNGKPLAAEARARIEARIALRSTLGRVAEARLDDGRNLAVGKVAPEIAGVGVDGKPLKLSDYRGKVVALVFWDTGCGPCMREIPREKALVERMKGRPFALLGVNTNADAADARKAIEAEGITWPTWLDGGPGDGPIARLYHTQGYPTLVLDAEGKIRSKFAKGGSLDQLAEELVAEREAAGLIPASGPPGSGTR